MVHYLSFDILIWIVFPYLAIAVMIAGTIHRYINDQYTFSSLSTQFLGEKSKLGMGSLLWHVGILLILSGHFMAMILTPLYKDFKEASVVLETLLDLSRYTAALAVAIGLIILIQRRISNPRLRKVTTFFDWTVLILLLYQVLSGFYMVYSHLDYEGFWFEDNLAPWIRSIFTFNPMVPEGVSLFSTIHVLSPFVIVFLVPFTRLVHMFTFPLDYMWRSYQIVVWNRERPSKEEFTD